MKRRRVTRLKSKARTVLSTRRRANKKNVTGTITARNNVYRMRVGEELAAKQATEQAAAE